MKKWTKVLSAFVVATVMSASMATAIGCGGDDDDKHQHNYSTTWSTGADGHWHECQNDGCDEKKIDFSAHVDTKINGTETAGEDGLCDICDYKIKDISKPTPGPEDEDPTIVDGKITNKAQLLAFRQLGEVTEGAYKLEADIDLEGVELPDSTTVLSGTATFDGQGHIIMNGVYSDAKASTGLLVAQIKGASVTNVKFLNCSVVSNNDWNGLVAGYVESGDSKDAENTKATFSKIEFNSCSVKCKNYAGLIYGGNKTVGHIEVSEITAKNGTNTSCSQYGGLLCGDNADGSTLIFKNLHLDGKFISPSGNGSFISGRDRGNNNITVENAVISAEFGLGEKEDNGLFTGNKAAAKLTLKNILIVKTNRYFISKAKTEPTAKDYSKVYVVNDSETPVKLLYTDASYDKDTGELVAAATGYDAENGTNSVAFLKDTLGLDFTNVWMEEGEGYRLRAASTNIKSPDATLKELKVSTSNAQLRYKLGATELNKDGLLVMGVYSDGVQLVLSEGDSADYTVDASGVDWTKAGKYDITIKGVGSTMTAKYGIEVVQQTGFKVYQDRMAHVYLEGTKELDMKYLSVKSVWSDNKEETLKIGTDYTIDGYDLNVSGKYTAKVHNGEFPAQDIEINVVKYIPVPLIDNKIIYVNVDKEYKGDNGAAVKGIVNFNELGDAIKYLEACKLDEDVTKVVYVGEGTFAEHIKTDLKNLTLVGKGADKTVLTCSNVQSTINPLDGGSFGLNENATLIVTGEGFKMYKMAVRNDFDYAANLVSGKESSPQGTALLIGGDKSVISDCLLYGNQDTLYLKNGRTYFKDTEIQGNIDFIFGEPTGIAYFDNCTIKAINKAGTGKQEKNNGYVTAMRAGIDSSGKPADNKPDYGYVFAGCQFTDDGTILDGSMSLARTWGPAATVAFVNCSFSKAYSKVGFGTKDSENKEIKPRWYNMNGSPVDADFKEYGSTGDGAITEAVNGGKIMTAEQAALHTKANTFAATNGKCTWGAAWDCDADLTALKEFGKWEFVAPDAFQIVSEVADKKGVYTFEEGKDYKFAPVAGPWNANDKTVEVSIEDNTVVSYENGVIKALKVGSTTLTLSKTGLDDLVVQIVVKAVEQVETEAKTYTFSYDNLTTAGNLTTDQTKLEAGKMQGEGNDFITITNADNKISWRSLDKAKSAIESKGDNLTVTFEGTGTLTLSFASTGGSNDSAVGLKDSDGEFLAATTVGEGATPLTSGDYAGSYKVVGTTAVTVTFTVTKAGTYTISCPYTNRAARISGIVMVDNVPKSGGSTVTKQTKTLAIPATGSWSAETALDDFFSVVAGEKEGAGTVKVENSKITNAGYAADELTFAQQISLTSGKVSTSNNGIKFVVDKEATVVIYAAQKSGKTATLSVLGSDGTAATISGLKINGTGADAFNTLPTTEVAKYEFTVAAGTYYIGGSAGGAYLYGLTVTF